jgi:hypothetical protein
LSLGDWDETHERINDKTVINNSDRDKMLVTVAVAVLEFIKQFPNATLYIKGSTIARTRLYQIRISPVFKEINQYLIVELKNGVWESFKIDQRYEAFLVSKKKV